MLAWGFDTIEETFDITIDPAFVGALERAKAQASDAARDDVVSLQWGEEIFHVSGHGGQAGTKFIFENDDLKFRVRSPEQPWPLSVRYLAAGLWEFGHEAMRSRVRNFLTTILPKEWKSRARGGVNYGVPSLKRMDFAVDIQSSDFTREMTWSLLNGGAVVAPSEVKIFPVGTSERLETLTIGAKGALQVQVYDKGKEIFDLSGKTWMFDLWKRSGWSGPNANGKAENIWRVEFRFFKDWLRGRGVTCLDIGIERLPGLMAEAIYNYRLTLPNAGDSNRRRWPLHPFWTLAADLAAGNLMEPLGKVYTMRKGALIEMLDAQAAGVARARGVLAKGDFEAADIPGATATVARRLTRVAGDRKAIDALKERYRFIDEAR